MFLQESLIKVNLCSTQNVSTRVENCDLNRTLLLLTHESIRHSSVIYAPSCTGDPGCFVILRITYYILRISVSDLIYKEAP